MERGAVIVVSSHVTRGGVGNRAMVFALERLGFTVLAVPTLLLPYHPGHGPGTRIVPPDDRFEELLHDLTRDIAAIDIAGIVSGYFATAGQVHAVAAMVRALKEVHAGLLYLCDPVIGDAGGLYVAMDVAAAIRDELLPLADAATPNAFECAWLAGQTLADEADLAALAHSLPPPTLLVTSTPSHRRGHVGNHFVQGPAMTVLEHPRIETPAKGTGDLLAALLLGRRLEGHDWLKAAELAVSSTFEIVAGTARAGADELLLPELQQAIIHPRAPVSLRGIRPSLS